MLAPNVLRKRVQTGFLHSRTLEPEWLSKPNA
jgi:hypothetical protein